MKDTGKKINKILTILSVLMIIFWAYKFFGAGGASVRTRGLNASFGLRRMFFLSLAACCVAYFVWQGLAYYYGKKYKLPDDDDE